LVERLLDPRKAEVVSAMRAIEDDAVALRFDDFLEDQLFFLCRTLMEQRRGLAAGSVCR
jgi:hypothetical protein